MCNTDEDERLLTTPGTLVSTAWEFVGHWERTILYYFLRLVDRGLIGALMTVNVPYMLSALLCAARVIWGR